MVEEFGNDIEEEENAYEKEREERIKRNMAKLEELQVARMANELAAPMIAAANAEKERQKEKRAALEAVTPRRHSTRNSAQQTRKLLSQQAQEASGVFGEEDDVSSDENAAEAEGLLLKRNRSRKDEDDYDPVDDMSEQEEGSEDEAAEDEVEAVPVSEPEAEAEAAYKRPRKSKASVAKAGGRGRGSTDRASFPMGDSSDEDAELQQALAMSLMEARRDCATADQGQTSAATGPSKCNPPGTDAQREAVPAMPKPQGGQVEDGAAVRGAARRQDATIRGRGRAGDDAKQEVPKGKGKAEKKGGGRKRAPVPLDASPENVQGAFAMLAGSRNVITAQSLREAWDVVRGGELPEGCMENMLTYAAELTGSTSLTASAFEQLVFAING